MSGNAKCSFPYNVTMAGFTLFRDFCLIQHGEMLKHINHVDSNKEVGTDGIVHHSNVKYATNCACYTTYSRPTANEYMHVIEHMVYIQYRMVKPRSPEVPEEGGDYIGPMIICG